MRRECRERFPCHRFQRKPLVSDPDMHHGTCATHVPWCMSGLLTRGGGESVPGIPGACATRNFTYLARGPWRYHSLAPGCRHVNICSKLSTLFGYMTKLCFSIITWFQFFIRQGEKLFDNGILNCRDNSNTYIERIHITETVISSFWRNLYHWLHQKLTKWQLPVQLVTIISSNGPHFCCNDASKSR